MSENISIIIGFVGILLYLCLMGIEIAEYIMSSYALFKLAKRRNINNSWLAWIPVGNMWIIGMIANNYDLKNGYNRKWQNVLITLMLIFIAVFVVFYSLFIYMIIATSMEYTSNFDYDSMYFGMIAVIYVGLVVVILASMALSACQFVCIYKIFESTVPEKAIKYLLLYILVPLAGAICLFKCYNKGYPEEITSDIYNQE